MEDKIFDEFLTDVKSCDFDSLQDYLLKDKIIFAIKSNIVRERLLIEDNLYLNKPISICRLIEQT